MAKIIPINQGVINVLNSVLSSVNERFRNMSFQERVKHYQNYLKIKELLEDTLKDVQEEADSYLHHDR